MVFNQQLPASQLILVVRYPPAFNDPAIGLSMLMLSLIFVIVCDLFEWKRICLIIGFVTRLPRRVQLVEQELLTLPEHLSSPPVFSGVRFTRCLVLCVCFVDRCLSFCPFSFSHYIICPSSIYASDYSFGIFKLNTTMFDW